MRDLNAGAHGGGVGTAAAVAGRGAEDRCPRHGQGRQGRSVKYYALQRASADGWLVLHESGTLVTFPTEGATCLPDKKRKRPPTHGQRPDRVNIVSKSKCFIPVTGFNLGGGGQ